MKKTVLAAAIALVMCCTPAFTADIIAPSVHEWAGPYIGLQGGYGWGTDNNDITAGRFTDDFGGFVGGVDIGWNAQSNNLVYGVIADAEFASLGAKIATGGDIADPGLNFLGSMRAKAGFAEGNALFYLTGGLAFGSQNYQISNGNSTENTGSTSLGYTVGAGIDYAVSEKVSVGLEYRYTDLGSKTFSSALFPFDTFVSNNRFSAVRANVVFHF